MTTIMMINTITHGREIIDPTLLYLRMCACMYILVCICDVFVYSYLP